MIDIELNTKGPPRLGRSLSVSQLKQYERCAYGYRLGRLERVWERPAAWLPQGTAVHAAAEAYERSGRTMTVEQMQEVYRKVYAEEVEKYAATTPNFEFWFRSGPYKGEVDIERRFLLGLEQVARYPAWYEKYPDEQIWIAPDGTPAIELFFKIDLDGIEVRGYIDAVIQFQSTGRLRVRDTKSGKSPGDDLQLGVYAVAVAETYGVEPPATGDYWMGVSGKATKPYDLTHWTRERVTEEFHRLADNIVNERFDPDPEQAKCMFCAVSASCEFAA
ncbi:RecB family exonuclease [Nocardia sp. IFM 10818]